MSIILLVTREGWIKADMGSARRGSYKLLSTMENPAITRFMSSSLRPHERLYLVKPYTGKTHQIRVALKSIGAPVYGDARYANAQEAKQEERGYLHAYALRFTFESKAFEFVLSPEEGNRFMTPECKAQIEAWQRPWECIC
jgi:tRNA pseudouridine32 synthase / 23S rRNA pseudouridine746 synthase